VDIETPSKQVILITGLDNGMVDDWVYSGASCSGTMCSGTTSSGIETCLDVETCSELET
jgi:hypothetical protein